MVKNYQWWYFAAALNVIAAVIWIFGNTNRTLGIVFLVLGIVDWNQAVMQKKKENDNDKEQ